LVCGNELRELNQGVKMTEWIVTRKWLIKAKSVSEAVTKTRNWRNYQTSVTERKDS